DWAGLRVAGDPEERERGRQLASWLLPARRVEPAALDQWKVSERQRIDAGKNQPMQMLAVKSAQAIYPRDEPRPKALTVEQVQAITRDDAQAWLRSLVAIAPIEVSVVGDIDPETAVGLLSRDI